MYQADTISAISTALGEGAIGIVRLSGDEAIEIANQVFKGKDLNQVASHTIHYGHIKNPRTAQVVDEVMVSVMRGPRSFTREDIVEINCHGGIVAVQRVLEMTNYCGGFCKNLENGDVLVELQGLRSKIDFYVNFMKSLKRIRVDHVTVTELPVTPNEIEFNREIK